MRVQMWSYDKNWTGEQAQTFLFSWNVKLSDTACPGWRAPLFCSVSLMKTQWTLLNCSLSTLHRNKTRFTTQVLHKYASPIDNSFFATSYGHWQWLWLGVCDSSGFHNWDTATIHLRFLRNLSLTRLRLLPLPQLLSCSVIPNTLSPLFTFTNFWVNKIVWYLLTKAFVCSKIQ